MAQQNSDDYLHNVARDLALSSNIQSEALKQLASQPSNLGSIAKSMATLDTNHQLLGDLGASLKKVQELNIISPAVQSLMAAKSSMARISDSFATIYHSYDAELKRVLDSQANIHRILQERGLLKSAVDATSAIPSKSVIEALTQIDSTRMLSVSLAAQAKLATLDSCTIGQFAGFSDSFSRAIATNLGNFTCSYESLINTVVTSKALAERLSLIKTYAPVEYYREIEVVEAVTVEDDSGLDDEPINEALTDSFLSADALLSAFDGRLLGLLHGARQALHSSNPDRARHVTTSVRELFTHVLHAMAPDEDVRQWATRDDFFHNNQPTRRARLLYVCRHIDCDPLSQFVQDDVKAALSFINSLHSGAHTIESELTTAQLDAIIVRMESLLVFLLQLRNV